MGPFLGRYEGLYSSPNGLHKGLMQVEKGASRILMFCTVLTHA